MDFWFKYIRFPVYVEQFKRERQVSPSTSKRHQKQFNPLLKEMHLKNIQSTPKTHAEETQILVLDLWISICTILGCWRIFRNCPDFKMLLKVLSHLLSFFLPFSSLNKDAQLCTRKVSEQTRNHCANTAVCWGLCLLSTGVVQWAWNISYHLSKVFFSKLAKSLAIVHPLISLAMFLSNLFLVLVSEMWEWC